MADIINLNVNIDKLDEDRYFPGKKGRWCDLVMIPTPNSEFGSWLLVQKSTKEERDSGLKMPIVGNADYAGTQQQADNSERQQGFTGSQASQSERPMAKNITHSNTMVEDGDEIPF
tara:strand:+ start:10956 stop:11303 length:348 start_codon:yes stop_codon:yes gene_type:complete